MAKDFAMGENEVRGSEAEGGDEEDVMSEGSEENVEVKKKRKPGMIYLSTIPWGYNVLKTKERFSTYGKVNRIFLQPGVPKNKKNKPSATKSKKPIKYFTEGWVEFESKRVAKFVAEQLNNTLVGGKKKDKGYSQLWNIKYLPRFKWAHLNERLAYEKASRRQRMRADIVQAKKESHHFANNLDISEKLAKWIKKNGEDDKAETKEVTLPKQRQMESEEKKVGAVKKNKKKDRQEFLTGLFGKT